MAEGSTEGLDRAVHEHSALSMVSDAAKQVMDALRATGLKSDGQISRAVLRKAVRDAGVPQVRRLGAVEELFSRLDPESTGTVDFVDLANELRAVRKQRAPARGVTDNSDAKVERVRAIS
jgi:Ca2+-binding EF-hand superfamily protein